MACQAPLPFIFGARALHAACLSHGASHAPPDASHAPHAPVLRRFVRDCAQQRQALAIEAIKNREADAVEMAAAAKNMWRGIISETAQTHHNLRVARNKQLAKVHQRWATTHSKRMEDDRSRRLEALKMNDFEAYQEMLKQQQGQAAAAALDSYAQISKFLSDTEEYLHKLAAKVRTWRADGGLCLRVCRAAVWCLRLCGCAGFAWWSDAFARGARVH